MSSPRPDHPAGPYVAETSLSPERRRDLIGQFERFPERLRQLVTGLNQAQLDTPYKKWTVRQIVHHLADSHVNAYIRFKLALTEDNPTIKPYDETLWSRLHDSTEIDPQYSLAILDGIHARWTMTLRSMPEEQFQRTYFHPELARQVSLDEMVVMYVWHGRHHGEMIAWLRQNGQW